MKTDPIFSRLPLLAGLRRAAVPALPAISLALFAGCQSELVSPGTTDETNTARIVGPGGSTAPGAVVRFFAVGDTTRTPVLTVNADDDGRYDLSKLPEGEYNLLATSGELALYRDSLVLGPGVARTDTLAHPGVLRGRVELQPGHDLRTVTVQALGTYLWSNVDTAGWFIFPEIPGGRYTLRATTTLPDYTPTFVRVETVDDFNILLSKPIEMVYTGTEPRIVQPDGKPAAGILVDVFRAGDSSQTPVRSVLTDAGGRYQLGALPAGRYNLHAANAGFAIFRDSIHPVRHINRVDTLGRIGSVRGRIELDAGHDPRAVVVWIPGSTFRAQVDSEGFFLLPRMPRGRYLLCVAPSHPGYPQATLPITAIEDSAVVLDDPIRLHFTGVPLVQGVTISYDTVGGLVRIRWNRESRLAGYVVRRTGPRIPLEISTQDTSLVDTVFRIGHFPYGADGRLASPIEGDWSAFPSSGGGYEVCGRTSEGRIGECSSIDAHLVSPLELRRSGVRWNRIGEEAPMPPDGRAFLPGVWPIRDSLWAFFPMSSNGGDAKVAVWKSGDGHQWMRVADSLPLRFRSLFEGVQVWRDSIWALSYRPGSWEMVLMASGDGLKWVEKPLPEALRNPGSEFDPHLLAIPEGLAVFFSSYMGSMGALPPGMRLDAEGQWQSTAINYRTDPLSGNVPRLSATVSGLWIANVQPYDRRWFGKFPHSSRDSVYWLPVGAAQDPVELNGLLYFPPERSDGYDVTGLFAASVSSGSSTWKIDFPGGRCMGLTTWRGKLLAIGSDGGVWQGEPTPAP